MKFSDYLNNIDGNVSKRFNESAKLIVLSDEYSTFINNLTKRMGGWQWSTHTDYKDSEKIELSGRFYGDTKSASTKFQVQITIKNLKVEEVVLTPTCMDFQSKSVQSLEKDLVSMYASAFKDINDVIDGVIKYLKQNG